jgi:hypothetical protein
MYLDARQTSANVALIAGSQDAVPLDEMEAPCPANLFQVPHLILPMSTLFTTTRDIVGSGAIVP